ncbi:MAG: hypothetical protein IJP06_00930 [Agathobacter sp.]|nr:hypothetical protein [Agathobacter sp.]
MRIYRCFIVVLMIVAIGFGVWYCTNFYAEQRSVKDGTLVLREENAIRLEHVLQGEG